MGLISVTGSTHGKSNVLLHLMIFFSTGTTIFCPLITLWLFISFNVLLHGFSCVRYSNFGALYSEHYRSTGFRSRDQSFDARLRGAVSHYFRLPLASSPATSGLQLALDDRSPLQMPLSKYALTSSASLPIDQFILSNEHGLFSLFTKILLLNFFLN